MHFSLIRDEDLIRVDRDGKVVEGGKNKRLNCGMLGLYFRGNRPPSDLY